MKEDFPQREGRERSKRSTVVARRQKLASVRMSPGGYLAVGAILTFVAGVCLRTHHDFAALVLVSSTWIFVPFAMLTDRLNFDGTVLRRTGISEVVTRLLHKQSTSIAVSEVERVEVTSLRTLRRGGNVRYRHRIEVSAGDCSLSFTSGGKQFRLMAQALLPRIAQHKLDARACELRDHLIETKLVLKEASRLEIAPVSVLENARAAAERRIEKERREPNRKTTRQDSERAILLRRVANDLRVVGRFQQSAEAFRRALLITPRDPWLIYEYARLLRSQASVHGDASLLGRACAALRLAGNRAPEDARLLERVGESFIEYGDPYRAEKMFRRALDVDENAYRAQLGLAEVALVEGKLAHVIHHYNEAVRIAPDKAAARLARHEADYYSRLNSDEDYLAAEVRRMNWLESAGRVQRLTARVSFAALLVALLGSSIDPLLAGVGWALATSSIAGWSGALVIRKFLASRSRVAAGDA